MQTSATPSSIVFDRVRKTQTGKNPDFLRFHLGSVRVAIMVPALQVQHTMHHQMGVAGQAVCFALLLREIPPRGRSPCRRKSAGSVFAHKGRKARWWRNPSPVVIQRRPLLPRRRSG